MKLIDVTCNRQEKTKTKGIIYAIANTKTGKIYIGQTIHSFNDRYSGGKWWLYSDNNDLKQDYEIYKKYFKIFILENELSVGELNEKETFYIQKLNTLSPNGYNKTLGGFNKSLCEEAKTKLSAETKQQTASNSQKSANDINASKWFRQFDIPETSLHLHASTLNLHLFCDENISGIKLN